MKKIIPFMLGSLLLLGATACNENAGTAATDGDGVRNDQLESDARARTQRDGTNAGTAATDGDGVRSEQTESDTRARDQRDGMNPAPDSGQQTTGDLAVDVRNSLESNLPGSRLAVDVDSGNGMATIDGTVQTQEQFDEIEPLVRAFEGITSVDVKAEVNAN